LALGMLGYLASIPQRLPDVRHPYGRWRVLRDTREAQTLLGPMMIILSCRWCQSLASPSDGADLEALLLGALHAVHEGARAATDPPWWEVGGTAA